MHFYERVYHFMVYLDKSFFFPQHFLSFFIFPGMRHVGSPSTRTMSTLVMLWLLPPAPTIVSNRVCPATQIPFPLPTAVCTYFLITHIYKHAHLIRKVVTPGHKNCARVHFWLDNSFVIKMKETKNCNKYAQLFFKRKA